LIARGRDLKAEELKDRVPWRFIIAALQQRRTSLFTKNLLYELHEAVTGFRPDYHAHREPRDLEHLERRVVEAFRIGELVLMPSRHGQPRAAPHDSESQTQGTSAGLGGAAHGKVLGNASPAGVSFTLKSADSGKPMALQPYQIVGANGTVLAQGVTDKDGHTSELNLKEAQEVTINILPAGDASSS
jgi:hypothetical protein